MAIYKVVLNGSAFGEDVKNILYYRSGIGLEIGGLTAGGTLELSQAVKTLVWPALKSVLPAAYRLQDITTYVYEDGTFNPIYQNPTTLGVGENGTQPGATNGPAVCAIAKFQLEPTIVLLNGPKPPKRGYLAIGPLTDSQVNNDGTVLYDGNSTLTWGACAFALGNNVEVLLPVPFVWFPVRVSQTKILGIFKITSYADVREVVIRDITSFRRSRQPKP